MPIVLRLWETGSSENTMMKGRQRFWPSSTMFPEVYTGDLPTPIKYFDKDSRKSYDTVEKQAVSSLLSKVPEELRPAYENLIGEPECPEKALVKAADKLCAYIKCLEEEKCGNYRIPQCQGSDPTAIGTVGLPGVGLVHGAFAADLFADY